MAAMTGGGNPRRWDEPPSHMARPASGPIIDDSGGKSQTEAEGSQSTSGVTSGVTELETVTIGTEASLTAQVSTHKPDSEAEWQRGDPEPPPPWKELMPSGLLTRLLALSAHVDQLAAEYRDPQVDRARRQEIHDYCLALYTALREVRDEQREVKDPNESKPESESY